MNANLTHPTGCQTNPPKAYDLSSVMRRVRTNAAAPKAYDMTLKEASHGARPHAQ
jgi:hypothetical protein